MPGSTCVKHVAKPYVWAPLLLLGVASSLILFFNSNLYRTQNELDLGSGRLRTRTLLGGYSISSDTENTAFSRFVSSKSLGLPEKWVVVTMHSTKHPISPNYAPYGSMYSELRVLNDAFENDQIPESEKAELANKVLDLMHRGDKFRIAGGENGHFVILRVD